MLPESSRETAHLAHTSWKVERLAEFSGWPSGIAVSSHGRIFVSFPQANGQRSSATLCEVIDGYAIPFPFSGFTSIHGVRCSEHDRIYALDTGATDSSPCDPNRAALWVLDAHSGRVVQRHPFRSDVVFPSSCLMDLALCAHDAVAYLLDSGPAAPNALIVFDLVSGHARRVLNDHPSMRASPSSGRRGVVANGKPLQVRDAHGHKQPVHLGVMGVALSSDDGTLFWSKPDMLYSVPTALLREARSDAELDAAINTWPIRHFSSDGLARDREGHILLTDVTHNAVQRLSPLEGHYELLASDPRISWPDGIAVGPDGAIYVTSSQFHRGAAFNSGTDARRPPFGLFRLCSRARRN